MKTLTIKVTEGELHNFTQSMGVSLHPEEDRRLVALKSLLIQKGARFRPSFSREFKSEDLRLSWKMWRHRDGFGEDYLVLIQTTYDPHLTSAVAPTA